MDIQLKEVIEKIKREGIESAQSSASQIIAEAEERAATIIKEAEKESRHLKESARQDAESMEKRGVEAMRQAGRDLVLGLKSEIENIFARIIENEVADAMDEKLLSEAVLAAVQNLSEADFELQIPEHKFQDLEAQLQKSLAEKIFSGMTIAPSAGLDAGFRLTKKDGSAFYDFSEKEIAAMLAYFLNPRLGKLLAD